MSTLVLLNIKEVCERLKISRNTLYRFIDAKKIPKPIKMGQQNRWRSDVIDAFIANDCKIED